MIPNYRESVVIPEVISTRRPHYVVTQNLVPTNQKSAVTQNLVLTYQTTRYYNSEVGTLLPGNAVLYLRRLYSPTR